MLDLSNDINLSFSSNFINLLIFVILLVDHLTLNQLV